MLAGEDEEEIYIGSAFTVGRQDFSIRSMDPVTGKERWNVTYSRLGISGSSGIASEGEHTLPRHKNSMPACRGWPRL